MGSRGEGGGVKAETEGFKAETEGFKAETESGAQYCAILFLRRWRWPEGGEVGCPPCALHASAGTSLPSIVKLCRRSRVRQNVHVR